MGPCARIRRTRALFLADAQGHFFWHCYFRFDLPKEPIHRGIKISKIIAYPFDSLSTDVAPFKFFSSDINYDALFSTGDWLFCFADIIIRRFFSMNVMNALFCYVNKTRHFPVRQRATFRLVARRQIGDFPVLLLVLGCWRTLWRTTPLGAEIPRYLSMNQKSLTARPTLPTSRIRTRS